MAQLMGDFLQSPVTSLKDMANSSIIAVALWKVNREQFPFYDTNSDMFISNRKSSDSVTMSEYRDENRKVWTKIIAGLAAVSLDGWPAMLEDFKCRWLDKAVDGDEDALEYFWLLFFEFLSKANYLAFKKVEPRYLAIIGRLKDAACESGSVGSGSKQVSVKSTGPLSGLRFSNQKVIESPTRAPNFECHKEYVVTDKSLQDLVLLVDDREGQLQLLREDLLFKERENNSLKDKINLLKADKKQLQEEILEKDKSIERLTFKVDKLELAVDQSWDKEDRMKVIISNRKIEDLYSEIDELQKKNSYLQRRIDDLMMVQNLGSNPEQLESEEKQRSIVKTLSLENDLIKDKLKILEQGSDSLTNKLLKEKEITNRLVEQIQDFNKILTQKEISIKGLINEKESLQKENLHLREVVQYKDYQFKGLEKDFSKIVDSGDKNGRNHAQHEQTTDDNVLELVKVCKEVNRYYKEELMCLYNLFHDHFVNQLTGTSLDDMIKKKLSELHRDKFMN